MQIALKKLKIFASIFVITGLFFSVTGDSLSWGAGKSPFDIFSSSDIILDSHSNGEQIISLKRQEYPLSYEEFLDSLKLTFDSKSQYIRSGEIIKAQYKTKVFPDSIGEAASFEQPTDELWISSADFLFLNKSDDTGDFSIYFRMRPYQIKRRMDIMQKLGLFEGRKQGFYCGWEGGKLTFKFYSFFWDKNNVPVEDLSIQTRDPFLTNKFYSVLLSYKSSDSSLTLYLNGEEQEKLYLTENFTPEGTRLIPRFHKWDRSPLIIGRNYLGAIDDIVLSNRVLNPEVVSGLYNRVEKKDLRFYQKPGVVISKRIDLPISRTKIEALNFAANIPMGTDIKYFYRFSDEPFSPDVSENVLPYYPLKKSTLENVYGKYFQWKTELYADAGGEVSPMIKKVTLYYTYKKQPLPPAELSLIETDQQTVTLEFQRNLELDVVNGGRYHIYYGIKPYQPLGVIKFKDFKPGPDGTLSGVPITDDDRWETDDQRYQNRIKIMVSNEMINANLAYFRNFPGLLYPYPVLQKDIPFYFWVTACDKFWSENPENSDHESKPSPVILVRVH